MAKMGFNIGRLINKGAKFAAGAGAFDSFGGGGGLLDTAKDMIGGNARAGAGASLSDRIKGGLSAVSPTFQKAQALKGQMAGQETINQINESKLETIRQDAIEKATPFETDSLLPEQLRGNERLQTGMKDLMVQSGADQDGDGTISQFEAKKAQEGMNKSGAMQRGAVQLMDSEIEFANRNTKLVSEKAQVMVDKFNTGADGVALSPTNDKYTSLAEMREMAKDPNAASTMDKKLLESINQLDKIDSDKALMTQAKNRAVASMSTQQILQTAQAAKIQHDIANTTADKFESTKKIESLSRSKFEKPFSDLSNKQQKDVMSDVLKRDPERLRLAFDLKKQFDGIEGIKAYKKVQVNFDIMSNTIERVLSGDAPSNLATDQTLVNTLNKIMDPQSVVRESEFERTGQGIALRNKLDGWMNKIKKGGVGLRDEDRQELVDQAQVMMESHKKYAQSEAQRMGAIAKSGNIDPQLVTGIEFGGGEQDTQEFDDFFGKHGGQ